MRRICLCFLMLLIALGWGEAAESDKIQVNLPPIEQLNKENIQAESEPNAQGEQVIVYNKKIIVDDNMGFIMLRKPDHTLLYLCQWLPGAISSLEVHPVNHIYWLGDGMFACVAAGRRVSEYSIYKISYDQDKREPENVRTVSTLVRGFVGFKVEWRCSSGRLEGHIHGKPFIVLDPKMLFTP